MNEIFIEAESFKEKGGWVIDQQSMSVLHSAYLMAHGMGEPVADAKTTFKVEKKSKYYVWCLTRDWTKTWGIKESAGKFQLQVDNTVFKNILGTNGKEWSWQLAGDIVLEEGTHSMQLIDLTGFNGRCDAIYLTDDIKTPSSDINDIDIMRKNLNYKGVILYDKSYDLIVVGGGVAGICTALSALSKGVDTLLINDRSVLGGCNSSEIRVCMGGQIKNPPYDKLGDVVKTIMPVCGDPGKYAAEYFEDNRKIFAFDNFTGTIMLNECVTEIEKDGDRISAVICTNIETGIKTKIKGKMFADCSGDAILATLGGAQMMYGKESKGEFNERLAPDEHMNVVMGHSIRWYSQNEDTPCEFPDLDWNIYFNDENYLNCTSGDWEQETGFRRDMVKEIEYIRDYGLRAIYANWSYQKNHCKDKDKFSNYSLKWVSYLGGKRESYRVIGDYILTENDLEAKTTYDDATAGITWGIDIHYPETTNERAFGEAFRSFAYHRGMPAICNVPYRCLYSKDIKNLFLGGRIISTTHVAFSAVRVMRTLGMLGEVVGMAAGICKEHQCLPRDVYDKYLSELKINMTSGIYIPDAFAWAEINDVEKYHFKDMEWWNLHNKTTTRNVTKEEIEKFRTCINEWNLSHKHELPDEWK